MKKVLFVILLIVCTISLTSCKKETVDYEQIYRYNLFEIVETLTEEEMIKQIEEAVDVYYDATYININYKSYHVNFKQSCELKIDNKKRELYSCDVRESFGVDAKTIVDETYTNNEFSYYKEKIDLREPTYSKYETRSFEQKAYRSLSPWMNKAWFINRETDKLWRHYDYGKDVYGNTVIHMTLAPNERYRYIPCMVIKDGKPIFFIHHDSTSYTDIYFEISYEKPKIEKPNWCDLAELKAIIK